MAEISDKTIKKIEVILNETMRDCLYGPGGDPGWYEMNAAGRCFEILKLLNLSVEGEEAHRQVLEKDNIWNQNFIEGL